MISEELKRDKYIILIKEIIENKKVKRRCAKMKKEIRKEKKIKRALRRLLRIKNKKIQGKTITRDNLLPRNIRRNKTRNLIKEDGLTKVNKRMKYYWKDVQAGAYKI